MAGTTDTQSIRFGQVTDIITHTMQANMADDIAAQLNAADAAALVALERPVAHVRRITSQGYTAGVRAAVSFDNEVYDTAGMFTVGVNPTRITAVSGAGTGNYMLFGTVTLSTTGTSTAGHLSIWKNGVTLLGQRTVWGQLQKNSITLQAYAGAVGDYFEMHFEYAGSGTPSLTFAELFVRKVSL